MTSRTGFETGGSPARVRFRTLQVALWAGAVVPLLGAVAAEEPGSRPPGPPPENETAPGPGQPAAATAAAAAPAEEVQLSFNGAEIQEIVKWIAEMTGKSVYLHKDVKCKPFILSTRKIPKREAILQVYRVLALEGFTAVETEHIVYIVPEAMQSRIGPGLAAGDQDGALAGKQILVKVFTPRHARATGLKEKIRGVLSEKAQVEVDQATNRLIVTDSADNLHLLDLLMEQIDVPAALDEVPQIIQLRHVRAEDLVPILTAVFAGGAAPPAPEAGKGPEGKPAAGAPPAGAGGSVRILADRASNRLIVTAPPEKLAEIRKLVESLDVEKPLDVAVRVIPLEHVDAQELVREIAPMYDKLRGPSLKETIEIAANKRSNSLIVLSSESNHRAIQDLVRTLDTAEAEEKRLEVFPLKYADAEDVADQLTELYEARDRYRSRYWYWDEDRAAEGETRFVASRRRNEVLVIGSPEAIERVRGLIKQLDEPAGEENLAPRIYPLKYVSAYDIEQVLNQLFLRKVDRRPYWWDDYEASEDRDIGRLYGKVRIASEPYTNSIILTSNSVENFAALEAVLEKLDVPPYTDTTLAVGLKYANAVRVANNINILFAENGAPPLRPQAQAQAPQAPRRQDQQQPSLTASFQLEEEVEDEPYFPWLGGQREGGGQRRDGTMARPVSDLVGRVRVVADPRTNSLLVTTAPHYFSQITKVVEAMDIPTPQVLLEAKIIEISKDDRDRLGVRWSPDGNRVFDSEDLDDSLLARGSGSFREIFAGSAAPDALRTGVVDATINLDLLIQFLRKHTSTRVRAEPRINVADNERGQLFVGSRFPFIELTTISPEGTRNDSFRYIDIGIIVEVTPHINASGDVALRIRVESSQVRPGETLFGGAIYDTRNYQTELTVRSGQTLVLGGIIQSEENEVERKIPILGDIPLLGLLFRKTDRVRRDVELMVFLRPSVTRSLEEVKKLMEEEGAKTPRIREWEEESEEEGRE